MLHSEDFVTRLYYVLHISASFLMALTIEHPDHKFFNFKAQAWYLAASSIIGRVFTAGMVGFVLFGIGFGGEPGSNKYWTHTQRS